MLAFADDAALSRLVIAAGRNAVHVYGLDLWSSCAFGTRNLVGDV